MIVKRFKTYVYLSLGNFLKEKELKGESMNR
jgi:hypothetical protein